MRKTLGKFASIVVVLALFLGVVGASNVVLAQSAKSASWSVSITYQNVGDDASTMIVNFYEEGSDTAITFNPLEGIGDGTLAAGAGASFWIGSVDDIADGWRGSAVVSSSQPLVATVVQFSGDAGVDTMRLLSNGFQTSDASSQYLIATVLLNKFSRTTVFSIQNTESSAIDATVNFYDADDNGNLASTITHDIPAYSTKYVDMSNTSDTGLPGTTTVFNGSAIVTAVLDGTTTSANVVAAAGEYYTNRGLAANFEGLPLSRADTTIYLATGICENFGLDTYYAVQNASLTGSAFIEVTYRNTAGNTVATDGRYEIGPGQKYSIITCSPSDSTDMHAFSGSAVINSYDAATGTTEGAPIVAIGKAATSINYPTSGSTNAFTAFMSEPVGVSKIALPFIRWASNANFVASQPSKQRSYIAIQNLEATEIKVNLTYKDRNGVTAGSTQTLTIPAYSKGNSDPNGAGAVAGGAALGMNDGEFGYYTDGGFGAGTIVEAHPDNPDAKFIAIVRVTNGAGAQEDYNGPPAP